jgi:hypothetical protein
MDFKSDIKGHLRTAREAVGKARGVSPPKEGVPSDWSAIVDSLAGVERLLVRVDALLGDGALPPKRPKVPPKPRQEEVGQAKESTTATSSVAAPFTAKSNFS